MSEKMIDFVLVGGPHVEADAEQRLELLADMATEVGVHAAQEAMATLTRICGTLPIEARMAALATAIAHIGWKLPAVTKETDKAKPGFELAVKDITELHETAFGNDFRRFAAETRRRHGL